MKAFVLDVDGVLTDGRYYYTEKGKIMKAFGADDNDALKMLRGKIEISFVTGDERGFMISKRRVNDMGYCLEIVPVAERIKWMKERWDLKDVIYMGDGILDPPVLKAVGYSICPSDGFYKARGVANYVTQHGGGHRAVAEACLHVQEKFGL